MRRSTLFLFIYLLFGFSISAQHQEIGEKPSIWKGNKADASDSNAFIHAFRNGRLNGHLRYFFMATDNESGLKDYYAHAAGGGIRFETAPYKGFQLGISGFFTFNIGSTDLSVNDAKTNQPNRYEIGLFDVEDPGNTSDIDRLEELFLKFSKKQFTLTIGKQLINTPFINLQDGRMRPTEVSGLWTEVKTLYGLKIEGGFLYQISPRGTVRWFGVDESIGVFSSGVNADGSRSGYAGNTHSSGIGLLGISHRLNERLSLKWWNMYVQNISNSFLFQADKVYSLGNTEKIVAGVQTIAQFRTGDGGNTDPVKRYVQDKGSLSFGAMFGWEKKGFSTSLNYTRITSRGRYLIPREWGRDPFYTFMPRERNEGLADVHALVMKWGYKPPKSRFQPQLAIGYYDLPSVQHYEHNKYGMPSYVQFNFDLRYPFRGILEGLNAQLLYVYKGKATNAMLSERNKIHKVNMHLWNIVFNYNF